MDRYPQSSEGHGSLRDIQLLVNGFPELFVGLGPALDIWQTHFEKMITLFETADNKVLEFTTQRFLPS